MKFIDMGSIPHFKKTIKDVQTATRVTYNEVLKRPNFDRNAKLPIIEVQATEKVHGTVMTISFNNLDDFWVQNKKTIITPNKDNFGCAFYAYHNKEAWTKIIMDLAYEYSINLNICTISIGAEWAGANIQKLSAISGLEKKAFIFKYFKVSYIDGSKPSYWLETKANKIYLDSKENEIYNLMNFPTISLEIDFSDTNKAEEIMTKYVNEIETSSKIGEYFGIKNNTGEGFVFTFVYKDELYKFKFKGTKHSESQGKIDLIEPVDEVEEQKKVDFVNNIACISWRLEQFYNETVQENGEKIENVGIYLRKVMNDIIKEESYTMIENGYEPTDIKPLVNQVAKSYYVSRLEENSI